MANNDPLSNGPRPTDRDRSNAAFRRQVADHQAHEYHHAETLAVQVLEPGWRPSMKLSFIRVEDCRPMGKDDPAPVPVAVAYKVPHGMSGRFSRRTNLLSAHFSCR